MSDILSPEELAAEAVGPNDGEDPQTNDVQQPDNADPAPKAAEQPRAPDGKFAPKAPESEQQPEKQGTVPQGALHAERERRKAAEARAEEAQKVLNRIAELRTTAQQPKTPDTPAGEQPTDELTLLRQKVAELEGGQKQTSEFLRGQQLDQAEHQQLTAIATESEVAFRAEHPDYDDAINHIVNVRAQELALYGLSLPEIQQTIREETADVIRSAIQQKRDPAELGYQIAKMRGYVPKQVVGADAVNGAMQDIKAAGTGKAADIVKAIGNAQAASKSIGQAAGGATAQTINAQTIANMTDDEFAELYATPEGKALIDSL